MSMGMPMQLPMCAQPPSPFIQPAMAPMFQPAPVSTFVPQIFNTFEDINRMRDKFEQFGPAEKRAIFKRLIIIMLKNEESKLSDIISHEDTQKIEKVLQLLLDENVVERQTLEDALSDIEKFKELVSEALKYEN